MKKSPLSTPNSQAGSPYYGQGRRRGYGYNQSKNDNDNYISCGSNNSPINQNNGNISFETSSPTHYQNRRNWRHSHDRRNQRLSNNMSSNYNSQSNSFQSSPGSPYSPQKHQRYQQHNYNRQKNEPHWHRQLPISEFVDIRSVFQNPWADLENKLASSTAQDSIETTKNDSSVEIIMEKIDFQNSSLESNPDESIINISSSCDEVKEGSSVDLDIENMTFGQDSKNDTPINVVSDSISASNFTSQENQSTKQVNQSQNDSVVEISQ